MKKIVIFLVSLLLLSSTKIYSQELFTVKTDFLPRNIDSYAFVPSDYDAKKKYPLVILLHGWSGDYKQWSEITDLQTWADGFGFIIVCPDGLYDSWYINSPVDPNMQYESFFFNDYLPFVENKFSIDTSLIFITGLSMGGHGALWLFTRQPEKFIAAGSMSGVLDLNDPMQKKFGVPKLLGEFGNENWSKFSVINHIDVIAKAKKPIIVDCGKQDYFHKTNERFYQKCKNAGVNIIYNAPDGKHNKEYWARSIKAHLAFFYKIVYKVKSARK